jgi:uncharacterized membrane protein
MQFRVTIGTNFQAFTRCVIFVVTIFFVIPFYLQSVLVHSVNGVKRRIQRHEDLSRMSEELRRIMATSNGTVVAVAMREPRG